MLSNSNRLASLLCIVTATALILLTFVSPPANAASTLNAVKGFCTSPRDAPPVLKFGQGLNIAFPTNHARATVRLYASYSWGWTRNPRNGQVTGGRFFNEYHVRFVDRNGRELWKQFRSVPNGGHRDYTVNSDVKWIQVNTKAPQSPMVASPKVAVYWR